MLFVGALVWFVVSARRHPGREEQVYVDGRDDDDVPSEQTDDEHRRVH